MNNLRITNIQTGDLPQIHILDKIIFPTQHYPYFVLRQLYDIGSELCFCVKQDNIIVGYIIGGFDNLKQTAWILAIGTKDKYINTEIDTKLLDYFTQKCVHFNFDFIQHTVSPTNLNSLNLFQKKGFYQVDFDQEYFGKDEERIILRCNLKAITELKRLNASKILIGNVNGNTTAIVLDYFETHNYQEIEINIRKAYHTVEQVGFLSTSIEIPKLIMAGNEFCGNATRIAGHYMLNGKNENIELSVSGLKINAELKNDGKNTDLNLYLNDVSIQNNINFDIVNLEGISFLICDSNSLIANNIFNSESSQIRNYVINLFELHSIQNKAIGLIIYSKNKELIKINPWIYTALTDTFIHETSCASGSIAMSILLLSMLKEENNIFFIKQPSKDIMKISINKLNEKSYQATVSGTINIELITNI